MYDNTLFTRVRNNKNADIAKPCYYNVNWAINKDNQILLGIREKDLGLGLIDNFL